MIWVLYVLVCNPINVCHEQPFKEFESRHECHEYLEEHPHIQGHCRPLES